MFSGRALIETLSVGFPVQRSRLSSLWLSGGLSARILDGDVFDVANSRDRVFLASLGANYSASDADGAWAIQANIDQGLPIFGATTSRSPLRSRVGGSGVATTAQLDITRLQTVSSSLEAVLQLHTQAASRALLSSQQCALGGTQFGRAFDESELVGDICVLGSAEVRLPIVARHGTGIGYLPDTQLYAFCDAGVLWKLGALPLPEDRTTHAQSCGGGLRAQLWSHISLAAEYARSIFVGSSDKHDRIFGSIQFGL